ncbi:arginine/serine-rich coiled-coil protein 2 isoform X2 [Hyposmocoma kahamanoa]|uniref:arginine/serine-rich coiled-coil protein 2 isoform X2 n=1 Tax=Hyposmocoma kahamanoa TaxID=1477025 RepID=UPI000E6D9A2D|nr:arginine/serine-rich coiled-coil protein 2 isoform X2 [Hyposmocoma kahamanoa]
MDSLVGYGSDDDNESERYSSHQYTGSSGGTGGFRRRDDDTNYDDVNMDMSEDSQGESEPELPPAEPAPARYNRDDHRSSVDTRERESDRRDVDHERRDKRRETSPRARPDKRTPTQSRRDDRCRLEKSDRSRGSYDSGPSRRGLLGDRPDDRPADSKPPALMDLKPFGGEPPPGFGRDARDAVSPRFTERERERDRDRRSRDRADRSDRDKDRERDRERHSRRSEERRSGNSKHGEHRSRSRGAVAFPPQGHSSGERRGSPPSGDYRPSSYKVNKKLEVMEKMGLQIKTPDGSMATAQQLRAAASDVPTQSSGLPSYYNSSAVQKRKLLWSNKNKSEAEEAAKWSGTRFAQDNDGKQVSKFMRLMGIKQPEAVKTEPVDKTADPIKKQEELFQAMQAQYEVARATTHTMRGVGLGFQRGQY